MEKVIRETVEAVDLRCRWFRDGVAEREPGCRLV
jgi:hypothetical protein